MSEFRQRLVQLAVWMSVLGAALLFGPDAARADDGPAFKIFVVDSGAYRVEFEDLVAAGLEPVPMPSAQLGLTLGGEPVPIWLEDGGDERFGPGDHLEFLGEFLAGSSSYYSEFSIYNVYRLSTNADSPLRMTMGSTAEQGIAPSADEQRLRGEQHVEQDLLRVRLPTAGEQDELWFWAKVIGGYPGFVHELDLPDLRQGDDPVHLRASLRGWSRPRTKGDPSIADHHVDVAVNGTTVASVAWDGDEPQLIDLPDLSTDLWKAVGNRIEISSPKRQEKDGDPMVDVVLLNWIEVEVPRTGRIGARQSRLKLSASDPGRPARLLRDDSSGQDPDIIVYGDSGWRLVSREPGDLVLTTQPEDHTILATAGSKLAAPIRIELDRPSNLHDPSNRYDYLMITHRRLRNAIEPLAEFHRGRGLEVLVVEIDDVYDEFSNGLEDPHAIQSFLTYAYQQWAAPAPRFVLLVGDASWDARNEVAIDVNYADWTNRPFEIGRFVKNRSTKYGEDEASGQDDTARANDRNLIPTLTFLNRQGPAASDNGFVTMGEEGGVPHMAIGRLPVTEPDEVAAIVDKTIRHISASGEQDPRKLVFVTSEARGYQVATDRVAQSLEDAGFETVKIYPESQDTSNERTTGRLIDAVDDGALAVYFFGHGGRYIWRTGPRDLEKNHDLMTLDHLDRLEPADRLPVVLSMTCYSAPFDHPSADSIGEKFLRIANRGAIAVIAASWRNSPSVRWGEATLRELTTPGATVGEALMRAKQEFPNSLFVHTYNLLGDPAVPVTRSADTSADKLEPAAGENADPAS